ncbi:MAG: EF-P beta-lysylation protein EpmB [Gammaproteobacteria bacterium]|nr:EF-P beta-lysylation protein EpmB [Gammaproteobacteria bacterium]
MIPRSDPLQQPSQWQKELACAIREPKKLYHALELNPDTLNGSLAAHKSFRLLVPHAYLAKMKKGDKNDPLLLQVLPREIENQTVSGFGIDPVGDLAATQTPGLLHKYHGRALLITTGACAIHCRYCFRRHFPYNASNASSHHWQPALDYLHANNEIHEVILSGGDPLTLSDKKLADLSQKLDDIPHLRTLRIHTRLPLVLPNRINDALLHWLRKSRLKVVFVLHANHANEIDHDVKQVCQHLRHIGVTLLNQTVLLKRINDSAESLIQLSHALWGAGVLPYYLHLLDRVQGSAHYECSMPTALSLMQTLREQLPGYLVPKLVREEAGKQFKTPIPDKLA